VLLKDLSGLGWRVFLSMHGMGISFSILVPFLVNSSITLDNSSYKKLKFAAGTVLIIVLNCTRLVEL
jgi:hypothetical protein